MYAPNYGFGAANDAQSYSGPPNPNQPGQQPQHMMYNSQQFGAHQSPYAASMAGVNPAAGGLGTMQSSGMTHMGGGNVPSYQTPYSNSPYGAGIPTSSVSFPPNYLAAQSNPSAFGMNPNMMSQRMQPPTSTPGPIQTTRQSPYGIPRTSPPNASSAQFAHNSQMRAPTPSNNTQVTSGGTVTPQTPTFPTTQNQASNLATPLSPGSEIREKERVTLLLNINRELLQEVVRLQAVQTEMKEKEEGQAEGKEKEKDAEGEKPDVEDDKVERDKVARAYIECMRRLQVNLAYLAAIADRPNKPASQVPAHPAIMTAPALSPRPLKISKMSPSPSDKKHDDKSPQLEEDRLKVFKDQYDKLLALFPGVDPKKEAPSQQANAAARAQAQQHAAQLQNSQGSGGQGTGAAIGNGTAVGEQQKMQSEMMRQRLMQQQQAQQQQQRAMVGQGR